jgi:hypothetical protein
MGALIQLRCCISGDVVERDNPDGYSLQVQKFETKSPGGLAQPMYLVQSTTSWMPHPWHFHGWAATPMRSGDSADVIPPCGSH